MALSVHSLVLIYFRKVLALRSLLAGSKLLLFVFKHKCNLLLFDKIGFRNFLKMTSINSFLHKQMCCTSPYGAAGILQGPVT
jgi:hypothetical protein